MVWHHHAIMCKGEREGSEGVALMSRDVLGCRGMQGVRMVD